MNKRVVIMIRVEVAEGASGWDVTEGLEKLAENGSAEIVSIFEEECEEDA